jgi:N-acetyl-gamma-glutamyl-phosphate reductase
LAEAVYGLAEINREAIKKARIVGLAGCYPTSVQLGLAPLLSPKSTGGKHLIDGNHIISDSKSGTSGAGRKAEIGTLLSEASDNFKAYGVKGHRHLPEIVQGLKAIAGHDQIGLTFVPHLTPMIRGIHSTLYVRLTDAGKEVDYQKLYENFYQDEPFVDVMPAGSHPETRSVRGSNGIRIAIHRPGGGDTLVILVVEDNLVKGASGQGVQCMNLMFGLPETTGLTQIAVSP